MQQGIVKPWISEKDKQDLHLEIESLVLSVSTRSRAAKNPKTAKFARFEELVDEALAWKNDVEADINCALLMVKGAAEVRACYTSGH